MPDASGKPGRNCPRCPRLKAFREDWRRRKPDWFNAPEKMDTLEARYKEVEPHYLLISVRRGSANGTRDRTRLYRMIELIGRWSMLDVFVVAFVVALIQFQPLMASQPGPGLPFFAAVVILTMLATTSFDPRLLWDAAHD